MPSQRTLRIATGHELLRGVAAAGITRSYMEEHRSVVTYRVTHQILLRRGFASDVQEAVGTHVIAVRGAAPGAPASGGDLPSAAAGRSPLTRARDAPPPLLPPARASLNNTNTNIPIGNIASQH